MTETIINSKASLEAYKAYLDKQWDEHKYLRISMKTGKQRTNTQNKSLHKFCEMLSDALNDAGLDMQTVLEEGTAIPWSPENVKNMIWKKVQKAQFGSKSTTELKTEEVGEVYETINRHLCQTFGVAVPWPCKETMNGQQ